MRSEAADDEFMCQSLCNFHGDCNWFSYVPSIGVCQELYNCSRIDTDRCPDCLTGQTGCDTEDPVCWVSGECQGNLLGMMESSSEQDCLLACKNDTDCEWFTFHPSGDDSAKSYCVLFKDCPNIDTACVDCVTGERRCKEFYTPTGIQN